MLDAVTLRMWGGGWALKKAKRVVCLQEFSSGSAVAVGFPSFGVIE